MNRIWHPWRLWEDHKAGFYKKLSGENKKLGEEKYADFLSSNCRFHNALLRVTSNWKYSCEHNLSNKGMNRIAYLGQASICYALSIPNCCRGGFYLLSDEQKEAADNLAFKFLNLWMLKNGHEKVKDIDKARKPSEKRESLGYHQGVKKKITRYVSYWVERGYDEGIPDEVPRELHDVCPSYRRIAESILDNDVAFSRLGFPVKKSIYYGILKRIELEERNK